GRELRGADTATGGGHSLPRELDVDRLDRGRAHDARFHELQLHPLRHGLAGFEIGERVQTELVLLQALRGALLGAVGGLDLRGLVVDDHDLALALVDAVEAAGHVVVALGERELRLDRERDQAAPLLALEEPPQHHTTLLQAELLVLAGVEALARPRALERPQHVVQRDRQAAAAVLVIDLDRVVDGAPEHGARVAPERDLDDVRVAVLERAGEEIVDLVLGQLERYVGRHRRELRRLRLGAGGEPGDALHARRRHEALGRRGQVQRLHHEAAELARLGAVAAAGSSPASINRSRCPMNWSTRSRLSSGPMRAAIRNSLFRFCACSIASGLSAAASRESSPLDSANSYITSVVARCTALAASRR